MMCALAHIGVHILHITLSAYQVFSAVAEEISFSVDIEKSEIIYYSGIFFLFYFAFTNTYNFVFVFRV